MDTAAVADLTAAQKLIEAELTRRRETLKALKTRPYIGPSNYPQQPPLTEAFQEIARASCMA